jgi:hypothetical protein
MTIEPFLLQASTLNPHSTAQAPESPIDLQSRIANQQRIKDQKSRISIDRHAGPRGR